MLIYLSFEIMLYMDLVFMFYINWFVLEYSYLKYEFEN